MRLTLAPAGLVAPAAKVASPKGRPGRKASPATQALIAAMQADRPKPRSRADYLSILREAGHTGGDNSAFLIMNREAKRIFGRPLGRGGASKAGRGKAVRGRGKPLAPAAATLRAKLIADWAGPGLQNPTHYIRWLVDQPGVTLGLKQARPVVYRELKRARQ